MSVFFIADLHFDDERIIKYENRPFENVKQMNETIICEIKKEVITSFFIFSLFFLTIIHCCTNKSSKQRMWAVRS